MSPARGTHATTPTYANIQRWVRDRYGDFPAPSNRALYAAWPPAMLLGRRNVPAVETETAQEPKPLRRRYDLRQPRLPARGLPRTAAEAAGPSATGARRLGHVDR
jgi:hypothetical protein